MLQTRKRYGMALVALALTVGLASCGDESDGDSPAPRDVKSEADYQATMKGSDKAQIAATLRYMRDQANSGNGIAYCAKLSSAGREQMLAAGGYYALGRTCPAVLRKFHSNAQSIKAKQGPVEIAWIKVNGDTAVARSKGGIAGRSLYNTRMVNRDGDWKVADVGFASIVDEKRKSQN